MRRTALACAIVGALLAPAASVALQAQDEVVIVMVTFRGCEEACRGFQDYIESSDLDAVVEVRDIDRDRTLLPGIAADLNADPPDLLVTWGTTVTVALLGTLDDDSGAVVGVPSVFMIVADPVGARIVESQERSGRPLVTGTFNRVPEETQLQILAEYRPFQRLGLVYNDTELNAVLKAVEIKEVATRQGFSVIERIIANGEDGEPRIDDIETAVADIAARDVDFLYVGSSSFLLENSDLLTEAATRSGIPVATAYETMVQDSGALISVASSYYNVGQLAAYQSQRILVDGVSPGDLEIAGLDRFRVLVNMETATRLGLFPPMLMLRYAQIVEGSP